MLDRDMNKGISFQEIWYSSFISARKCFRSRMSSIIYRETVILLS